MRIMAMQTENLVNNINGKIKIFLVNTNKELSFNNNDIDQLYNYAERIICNIALRIDQTISNNTKKDDLWRKLETKVNACLEKISNEKNFISSFHSEFNTLSKEFHNEIQQSSNISKTQTSKQNRALNNSNIIINQQKPTQPKQIFLNIWEDVKKLFSCCKFET